MTLGLWTTECRECGTPVPLTEPVLADLAAILDESSYNDLAALRGTCPNCSVPASVIGPVVFVQAGQAFVIAALAPSARLPGDTLIDILNDLYNLVPGPAPNSLTIYPTYDHFLLDHARPDLYYTVTLREVLSRHTDEEVIFLVEIANDMMQLGDPLTALTHCCRYIDQIPDVLDAPDVVENLHLLSAAATIKGGDDSRLQSCKDLLSKRLAPLQNAESSSGITVTWKVPGALGDDAPLIDGVPAGYLVPSTYVQREDLTPDQKAISYFLLLLFSSAFRQTESDPAEWQLMRHQMLQRKVETSWGEASPQCRSHIIDMYRLLSGGRSIVEDMSLDADE
jgi:hypothetical protein